jgi:uncharacterized protein
MFDYSGSPITFVVKIAQRCNLSCTYCYMYYHNDRTYRDKPPLLSIDIYKVLLDRLVEYCGTRVGQQVVIAFHGGEPMLVGAEYLDLLASIARDRLGGILAGLVMQTNATLVTDAIIAVLHKHSISVGVSMDGPQSIHDQLRVYPSGGGSYNKVIEGFRKLNAAGVLTKLLCVINPNVLGLTVYKHFLGLGVRHIDFLLPDECHDTRNRAYKGPSSTPIADYLLPIFDEWFGEDNVNVRIRIFEDIIRSLLGGVASTDIIGNQRPGYMIVDTDGSLHMNDVLKICDEDMSAIGLNVLSHRIDEFGNAGKLFRDVMRGELQLCSACKSCSDVEVCGGGYMPHRYSNARKFDNPSVWCADLMKLIRHIRLSVVPVMASDLQTCT